MTTKLTQRGDTLIEVLIALVILGLVLVSAYSSTSRSLRSARQAQERSEATKLAEAQAERLKSLAPQFRHPDRNVFITATPYCIDTSNTIREWATPGDPEVELKHTPPYPAECVTGDRYFASITYDDAPDPLFTILVRWERIGGGEDNVRLNERLYQLP